MADSGGNTPPGTESHAGSGQDKTKAKATEETSQTANLPPPDQTASGSSSAKPPGQSRDESSKLAESASGSMQKDPGKISKQKNKNKSSVENTGQTEPNTEKKQGRHVQGITQNFEQKHNSEQKKGECNKEKLLKGKSSKTKNHLQKDDAEAEAVADKQDIKTETLEVCIDGKQDLVEEQRSDEKLAKQNKEQPLTGADGQQAHTSHTDTFRGIKDEYEDLGTEDLSASTVLVSREILINVKTLTGRVIKVYAKLTDTIGKVMEKIKDEEGIAVDIQRLIFEGKQLEENHTLLEYNIGQGTTIHLVVGRKTGQEDNTVDSETSGKQKVEAASADASVDKVEPNDESMEKDDDNRKFYKNNLSEVEEQTEEQIGEDTQHTDNNTQPESGSPLSGSSSFENIAEGDQEETDGDETYFPIEFEMKSFTHLPDNCRKELENDTGSDKQNNTAATDGFNKPKRPDFENQEENRHDPQSSSNEESEKSEPPKDYSGTPRYTLEQIKNEYILHSKGFGPVKVPQLHGKSNVSIFNDYILINDVVEYLINNVSGEVNVKKVRVAGDGHGEGEIPTDSEVKTAKATKTRATTPKVEELMKIQDGKKSQMDKCSQPVASINTDNTHMNSDEGEKQDFDLETVTSLVGGMKLEDCMSEEPRQQEYNNRQPFSTSKLVKTDECEHAGKPPKAAPRKKHQGRPLVFTRKLVESDTVIEGYNLKLECCVSKPDLTAKWFKDETPIEDNERMKSVSSEMTHSLEIDDVNLKDSGIYTVKVENILSTSTVNIEEKPVMFTLPLPKTLETQAGKEVTFECQVSKPDIEAEWTVNGQPVKNGGRFESQSTCMTHILVVKNVDMKDVGEYVVRIREAESRCCLQVYEMPSAPKQLIVGEVTSESCQLHWQKPESNGGSSIKGYLVQMQEANQTDWIDASRSVSTRIVISNLIRKRQYLFRVAAENEYLTGEFAEIVGPISTTDVESSGSSSLTKMPAKRSKDLLHEIPEMKTYVYIHNIPEDYTNLILRGKVYSDDCPISPAKILYIEASGTALMICKSADDAQKLLGFNCEPFQFTQKKSIVGVSGYFNSDVWSAAKMKNEGENIKKDLQYVEVVLNEVTLEMKTLTLYQLEYAKVIENRYATKCEVATQFREKSASFGFENIDKGIVINDVSQLLWNLLKSKFPEEFDSFEKEFGKITFHEPTITLPIPKTRDKGAAFVNTLEDFVEKMKDEDIQEVPVEQNLDAVAAWCKEIDAVEKPFCVLDKEKKMVYIVCDTYEEVMKKKHHLALKIGKFKPTGIGRRGGARPKVEEKNMQIDTPSEPSFKGSLRTRKHYDAENMQEFQADGGIKVYVYKADILKLQVDCIVNAANENLQHGGGVAAVIARAAGPSLTREGNEFIKNNGVLPVGNACVTTAGNLPYRCVVHTVGPVWSYYKPYTLQDVKRCEKDLYIAIMNSFYEAEKERLTSIALPAISSAIFAVPKELCVHQYAKATFDYCRKAKGVQGALQEIHFIDRDLDIVKKIQKEFQAFEDRNENKYDSTRFVKQFSHGCRHDRKVHSLKKNTKFNVESDLLPELLTFEDGWKRNAFYFLENNEDSVIVCHCDIFSENETAIVVPVNKNGKGGAMFVSLTNKMPQQYHSLFKSSILKHIGYYSKLGDVALCPGYSCGFTFILCVVYPYEARSKTTAQRKADLFNAYTEIFKVAVREEKIHSVLTPMFGIDSFREDELKLCAHAFLESYISYCKQKMVSNVNYGPLKVKVVCQTDLAYTTVFNVLKAYVNDRKKEMDIKDKIPNAACGEDDVDDDYEEDG